MSVSKPLISVVVPCYQSVAELPALEEALTNLHAEIQKDFSLEVVLVDDGSTDGTLDGLKLLKQNAPFTSTIVVLTGNFGSYSAFHAGIITCNGDAVIQLHADLQDSPKHIPQMLEKWNSGTKLVIGQRVGREEGLTTRFFSGLYHNMVKQFALPHIPSGGYDLILFDRIVADHLKELDIHNINLVYLISWVNQRYETVPVIRERRKTGVSQWSFSKKVKLVIDTLLGFSYAPISWFRLIAGIGLMLFPLFCYLTLQTELELTIKLSVIIAASWMMVLMIGLILVSELLWRTFTSARKRPPYIIEKVIK